MRVAAKTAKKITATITKTETQVIALQRVFLCQGVGYKTNSKCGIFGAVSTQFQSLSRSWVDVHLQPPDRYRRQRVFAFSSRSPLLQSNQRPLSRCLQKLQRWRWIPREAWLPPS